LSKRCQLPFPQEKGENERPKKKRKRKGAFRHAVITPTRESGEKGKRKGTAQRGF